MFPITPIHHHSLIRGVLLVATCLPAFVGVTAQDKDLRFSRLSVDEGLSQGIVYRVLQDHKGFIWFCTQDGLNRYDGYSFRVYRNIPEDPESLSESYVYTIFEDSKKRLWVGTSGGGLNLFNRKRESFQVFRNEFGNEKSLSHDKVTHIYEDPNGILWISTHGGGLNRFDPEKPQAGFIHFMHEPDNPESLGDDKIWAMYADPETMGRAIWLGTEEGGLNRFDPVTGTFQHYVHDPRDPNSLSDNEIWSISGDGKGRLWIGTWGAGINRLDPDGLSADFSKARFVRYRHDPDKPGSLASDLVFSSYQDKAGTMWFGLGKGGMARLDPEDVEAGRFQHYTNSPSNSYSLSADSISSVYEDRAGVLWVGTYGEGVNRVDLERQRSGTVSNKVFSHYHHDPERDDSLSSRPILGFAQDRSGRVWVATQGNGIDSFMPDEAEPVNTRFINLGYKPFDDVSLAGNKVCTLLVDKDNVLWVGMTNTGLDRLSLDGDTWMDQPRFKHYRYEPGNPRSLSDDTVGVIYQDQGGDLWIGTNNGLNLMDREQTGNFTRFMPGGESSLAEGDVVTSFREDPRRIGREYWVGTWNGLCRFNRNSDSVIRFKPRLRDTGSISDKVIYSMDFDRNRNLWIGTGGGINLLRANQSLLQNPKFESFTTKDGLVNDVVYGVLTDDNGNVWMSTSAGLSRFDPTQKTFTNFDVHDGLQGDVFSRGASFRDREGRMYFGGDNGFNRFLPTDIKDNPVPPYLVITEFSLFNERQEHQRFQEDSPLPHAIEETDTIVLPYHQNMFTLRFAGLHFAAPQLNGYRFKLEGIDKDWIDSDPDDRRAMYANLDPEEYVFRVKSSNKDGVWNEEGIALKIIIARPPWQTWWAYTLYFIVAGAAVLAYLRTHRRKLKNERAINERLRQVDRLKDDFLANTSHELRTPLNGIIGLTESLIDGSVGPVDDRVRNTLEMVVGSGRRLASLVDDILDFSKLKNRSLDLQKKSVDLHALTEVVFSLLRPLIGSKDLKLIDSVRRNLPPVLADENRLIQVMHNLVGNAIKFTERGRVEVTAIARDDMVEVCVSDTGVGIPEEKFDDIFQSFEQADGSTSRAHGGTGLGLTVSKQLIELHGGHIGVRSRIGRGSTFYFTLPVYRAEIMESDTGEVETLPLLEVRPLPLEPTPTDNPRGANSNESGQAYFRILVVDDDPINRHVLVNHLSLNHYLLTEAGSGPEALEIMENEGPFDLAILDVMMPRMTGYEVCQEIRRKWSVHELPVIFLTAKNQVEDLLTAFDAGGNDFLTKPVNKLELLSRVRTHLRLLDITRTLERKVQERTEEVEEKHVDLIEAQKELVAAAHSAGMAEIANAVLHNVGNTLNSVQTSAQMIGELLDDGRTMILFEKVISLMESEAKFQVVMNDPARRKELSAALHLIFTKVSERKENLQEEIDRLQDHVKAIMGVLNEQREYSRSGKAVLEEVDLNELINETLNMKIYLFEDKRVTIVRDLEDLPPVRVEKTKFKRVLFYLLDNAREAIEEHCEPGGGRIRLHTTGNEHSVRVEILDNGIGIPGPNLGRVFTQGFSTKQSFRGFGLHYCAGAMMEMSGSIEVNSGGHGKGVAVALTLPRLEPTKSEIPKIATFNA
ncbi:MAG: ATP-binding protein [Acidobacteriota bacterium]|nr:ATP-binding protein [Acidobacteriota bacterium]